MDLSFEFFLCSYLNWCNSCSHIDIGTAVNVSTVDWSGCTDTRQYNMTVTNSDSVVLYRNSTTCCSGNLAIHYDVGQPTANVTTARFDTKPVNAAVVNHSLTDFNHGTSVCYSNIPIAIIVLMMVFVILFQLMI
uniref:Uncharacterized protein n=2 Tax=Magallana gigas TaxID=29159 RepID=A0A8W8MN30_MAGGI